MTIERRHLRSLTATIAALESLALSEEDYVFRGHREESWRISSTFARHTSLPLQEGDDRIDDMLLHFIINKSSIGSVPNGLEDRRSRLEYGRHHGVPTPVIDFSWSPYVALFFAFDGVRYNPGAKRGVAAVYALNIEKLAAAWVQLNKWPEKYGTFEEGASGFSQNYRSFLNEGANIFKDSYPTNELRFIRHAASWNKRMQRQLGCFFYDSIDYKLTNFSTKDFEGLVHDIEESPPYGETKASPTMIKFILPHSWTKEAFQRLELMGLMGTRLLDHDGAAADVRNAYNYRRRSGYAWDLKMPDPEDS